MKGQLSQSIERSLNRGDPFNTSGYRRAESKLKINMHQMQHVMASAFPAVPRRGSINDQMDTGAKC